MPTTCRRPPRRRPPYWKGLVEFIVETVQEVLQPEFDKIHKEIRIMGQKTDASIAHLSDDLHVVHDVVNALEADNAALRANNATLQQALSTADADKAAAVQEQLVTDDTASSAAIDQARSIIADLVEQADNPPADGGDENPPADNGGDTPAPADGGDTPADGGDTPSA